MEDSIVEKTLLPKFWELIKKEKIGSTPKITEELDELTIAIRNVRAIEKGEKEKK